MQVCHLTFVQRYVAFYNVLGALADAVDKLFVAFSNVLPLRPVTHLPYALQHGQILFDASTHSFGT